MFEAVAALLNNSGRKLTGYPIIITLRTELTALIEKIRSVGQTVEAASAGKTNAKDVARSGLSALLLVLANSLYVYAKRNSMQDLKAISNVSKTKLNKMKENELVTTSGLIINKLNEQKANLADYAVTDEKINALVEAHAKFQKAADTKDTGEATRIAAHDDLERLFDDTMDLLEDELDGLMENIKEADTDFYDAYFAARVIKDLGGHKNNSDDSQDQTSSANQTTTTAS